MPSAHLPTRGSALIEVLVALIVLELAAVSLVGVLLLAARVGRAVDHGVETDLARWGAAARLRADSSCRDIQRPDTVRLPLPATAHRADLEVVVRCGS